MTLSDETTWPAALLNALEHWREILLARELSAADASRPSEWNVHKWEAAIHDLSAVIKPFTLHGYHSTRLTEREIDVIQREGLSPPNPVTLKTRIEILQSERVISKKIARRLLAENQAANVFRAGRIWFCFYPPHIAGQAGIERFFRSWGGEALYNYHERNPVTGPVLGQIGTPCVIEADAPIAGIELRTGLVMNTARQFLINRGLKTREPAEHEDSVRCVVPAKNIRRIIRFPSADFLMLTGCDQWEPSLT